VQPFRALRAGTIAPVPRGMTEPGALHTGAVRLRVAELAKLWKIPPCDTNLAA
jgi:hypothetical protein